jgi:hypothetical protein
MSVSHPLPNTKGILIMNQDQQHRRARTSLATKILAGLVVVAGLTTMSTPAQAVAGAAVASRPSYNANLGLMQYNCAFAGWSSSTTKSWSCKLKTWDGYQYDSHSGTFYGTGFSTSTYSYVKTNTQMCVHAYASGLEGSDSDVKCF